MKYRKKPVVIEAYQWLNQDDGEIFVWLNEGNAHWGRAGSDNEGMYISTLEGRMYCAKGDWLIKGIKNEFYPCKPDIFEATYEPVQTMDDYLNTLNDPKQL